MEYFIKIAQRLITLMTLRTTEGSLFEIDARLSPSGNAGPLVTTLESFERYHAESAQLWERQALINVLWRVTRLGAAEAARRFAYERPWDPSRPGNRPRPALDGRNRPRSPASST
jgi:glutamate-ammonia-ligase adenylyltransferase